jgi:membrane peptidoglycan carboxypeptidase
VQPEAVRRTIRADTAATLTTIMEGVVERGTAKAAQIDGYTIAGKTGTASKLVNGQYSKQKYFSSFVGFMPSRKPAITVLVMIDSPSAGAYFGGTVAAPVFKRIVETATRRLGIARTINPEQPVMMAQSVAPAPAQAIRFVPSTAAPVRAGDDGVMPDLRGLSARAAIRTLARLGVVPRMSGSGFVSTQQPDAGSPLSGGDAVALMLTRQIAEASGGDTARP